MQMLLAGENAYLVVVDILEDDWYLIGLDKFMGLVEGLWNLDSRELIGTILGEQLKEISAATRHNNTVTSNKSK